MGIFIFIWSKPLLRQCRQSLQLWKKAVEFLFFQERKIMFFTAVIQGFLNVNFYWKFSKNFYPEHWLGNLFCAFSFHVNLLNGENKKLQLQQYWVSLLAWAFVFKVSRNLKSKTSNLVLDLFTWSVLFYNDGFLWCMFLVAEKIFSSLNIKINLDISILILWWGFTPTSEES